MRVTTQEEKTTHTFSGKDIGRGGKSLEDFRRLQGQVKRQAKRRKKIFCMPLLQRIYSVTSFVSSPAITTKLSGDLQRCKLQHRILCVATRHHCKAPG
jgi:hypothetical protein